METEQAQVQAATGTPGKGAIWAGRIASALPVLMMGMSAGAILVTGYLGGATATHVRAGEAVFLAPVVLGILAWGGLFLRDSRLRSLLPVRRSG